MNYTLDTTEDIGRQEIQTKKSIIFQDGRIGDVFHQLENKFSSFVLDIGSVKKICNLDIEWDNVGFQIHSPVTVKPSENNDSSNNIIFNTDSDTGTKIPKE